MNSSNVKENIKSGTYKISDKRGRSKIWECFGIIKDENDEEILNFVACKTCTNVYKYNKSALSNLNKHKCYILMKSENKELVEPNQEAKKACTEVLTNWVVQDIRPYSIVNDAGLKEYSKLLLSFGIKFGSNLNVDALIPHPTTISRNVENSYIIQFNKLHSEISSIREIGYSLTCDLWTENFSKISYLALTCHFIMDGECKNKLLGVKSMKGSPNTGKNTVFVFYTHVIYNVLFISYYG